MADEPSKELAQPGRMEPLTVNQVGGAFTFTPKSITEAMDVAKAIANSDLCPKDYLTHKNPSASILVAVMMGAKFGLDPFQAVQSIAVINGRPAMWGDAVLGIVKQSGLLEQIVERKAADALAAKEGSCIVKRKGESDQVTRTFSMAEAEAAGLIERSRNQGRGSGPWITYPGRMLQMRARAFALRDVFPDVLKGLRIREEEDDIELRDAEYSIKEPQSKTIPKGAVDQFLKETGGAAPRIGSSMKSESARSVDRSKLEKVMVLDAREKQGGGSTFFVVIVEFPNGKKLETSTFDRAFFDVGEGLKSKFALISTKTVEKGEGKDKKTYHNLTHIERAPEDASSPSDQGELPLEPGSNG